VGPGPSLQTDYNSPCNPSALHRLLFGWGEEGVRFNSGPKDTSKYFFIILIFITMKFSESIVSNVAPSGLGSDHGEPYGGGRRAGGQQRRQPFRRRRSWRPRGIQCGLGETKARHKKSVETIKW
jgi:hypothetical protein